MLTPGTLAFDPRYGSLETMLTVDETGVFQIAAYMDDDEIELATYDMCMVGDETLWQP